MDTETAKDWFQIGTAIVLGLSGIGYGTRQAFKFLKKKKVKNDEDKFNYVNMRIWNLITDLRDRGKASRVSVVQFHNGGKFMDGSSMRRMSISSQACDPKVSSTMQFRQDVLVSRFVELIGILQENNSRIRMVSEQRDSNSKKFHELHDTLAFSMLPIYCSDSLLIQGYISVEWCDLRTLDKLDESNFGDVFINARSQIAFLLSTAKDYR